MIFFRADANEKIATGHIMRCSAIAQAFSDKGREVCFIVADKTGEELVNRLGFPCLVLGTSYDRMDEEKDLLKDALIREKAELLFVDSYFVCENYFDGLNDLVKTVYLDDFLGKKVSSEILINYDLSASKDSYEGLFFGKKMLLGGKYTPLRKPFWTIGSKQIKEKVGDILVLTGGSDQNHVILNICRSFTAKPDWFEDCLINVVCGRYNPDYEAITKLADKFKNIIVFRNIDNIADYMKKADVCMTAGGTTTKELAACGTPSITYSVADNQLENVKSLEDIGLMEYAGDVRNKSFDYDIMTDRLFGLCKDAPRRKRESVLLQKTIDGKGAIRIAEELLK